MTEQTPDDTPDTQDAPETPAQDAAQAAPDPFDGVPAADPTDPVVQALVARTREEYARFTARGTLTFGGALAFTAGSPVPTHHTHVTACPPSCGCGVGGWLNADLLDDATPGEPIPAEL